MFVLRLIVAKALHQHQDHTIVVVLLLGHIARHRVAHVLQRQQEAVLHYVVSKCHHNVRLLRHQIVIVQVVLLLGHIARHQEVVVQVAVLHMAQAVHQVEVVQVLRIVHHILQEDNLKV